MTTPANNQQTVAQTFASDVPTVEEPAQYESLKEMLKLWAVTPNLRIVEDIVTRDGTLVTISRRLTIKERLAAAGKGAEFYDPKLKSTDVKVSTDVEELSTEELKEKARKLLKQYRNDQDGIIEKVE